MPHRPRLRSSVTLLPIDRAALAAISARSDWHNDAGQRVDPIVRLNYGCDRIRLPGYIGIDIRPSVAADHVLPAWDTSPWQPNSVDEIYSRHMLEHLDPEEANRALIAWFKVLRPGGLLRLIVPDLEFHAASCWGHPQAGRTTGIAISNMRWRVSTAGAIIPAAEIARMSIAGL